MSTKFRDPAPVATHDSAHLSLPEMKGTQREGARQEQAFITVQWREIDHTGSNGSIITAPTVFHSEVVNVPGLRCKMSHSPRLGFVGIPHRLQTRAKMMFSGSDRNVEIGIAMRCSHPHAVEALARSGSEEPAILRIVLNEIHQCLASLRLSNGVLTFVCFHVEPSVFGATTRRNRGICKLVLCKNWRCE